MEGGSAEENPRSESQEALEVERDLPIKGRLHSQDSWVEWGPEGGFVGTGGRSLLGASCWASGRWQNHLVRSTGGEQSSSGRGLV